VAIRMAVLYLLLGEPTREGAPAPEAQRRARK
jgi:hypothetical protein